jgi:hypothetical protein
MINELTTELNRVIDLVTKDQELFSELEKMQNIKPIVFLNLGYRIGQNEAYIENLQNQLNILNYSKNHSLKTKKP